MVAVCRVLPTNSVFGPIAFAQEKKSAAHCLCHQCKKNDWLLSVFTSGSFVFQKHSYCEKFGGAAKQHWCFYDLAFVFHMTYNCSVFHRSSECAKKMFLICSFGFRVDIVGFGKAALLHKHLSIAVES